MTNLVRQEVATAANPVVVKIGTRVLTSDDGCLDMQRITSLAEEIASLSDAGRRIVLVSSGAVGAGMGQLQLGERPNDLASLQAVAAVGQSHLIQAYDQALRKHGRHAAQLLLTAEDLHDRIRYLNVRNTLFALLEFGAIPIINENDTVSVEELQISFGDNDRLAAMVTNLLRAPLLVLLTDIDGLYDGDPSSPAAKQIRTVTNLDESIFALARDKLSGISKGGMASKLEAARIATSAGENVIIASGKRTGTLTDILAGKEVGTLIMPRGQMVTPRKRWIGFAARTHGVLTLDGGAARAVIDRGSSLLAIGISAVEGNFTKGDIVSLQTSQGKEIARGLINYSAEEVRRIQGCRKEEIAEVIGHRPYDEVIHRDNLMLLHN